VGRRRDNAVAASRADRTGADSRVGGAACEDDFNSADFIAPSVTLTDRVKQLLAPNKDIGKLASTHLLGLGQPIHVANMAV
jgi:hypothetical protein